MNSHTLSDGRTIRLVSRYILVERQPPPERSAGGIILIDGGKLSDGTEIGKVLAVGYQETKKGKRFPIRDIVPGMMCSYLWFYSETHSNQGMRARLGDNISLIRPEDIGVVWDGDETHTVSDIVSMGR